MGGASGTYGESSSAQRVQVVKLEGKRPLCRPRLVAADSVNVDRKQIGWEEVSWISVTQEQVARCCEHSNEHSGSLK
jgi:hypothetical protein